MNLKKNLILNFFCLVLPSLYFSGRLHAQVSTPASVTNTNVLASTPAPTDQAPDDVLAKLADLIHAEKFLEAQQLTAGLLLAYPDDQRLVKAKALLDKLVNPQPTAQTSPTPTPAADTTAPTPIEQLTGMDKVEYNSLIVLGRQAQQATDLGQQKQLEQQFMEKSGAFVKAHPDQILIWELRAAAALSLDDMLVGYEAGQKLLAMGAADSNDPNALNLLSQLNLKGWLDKQRIWVFGIWKAKCGVSGGPSYPRGEEDFVSSGSTILGYEVGAGGAVDTQPDLRGTFQNDGEISWECYYSSGWQPVVSSQTSDDKLGMTICIPPPESSTSKDPITFTFTRPNDAQNQQKLP